ncbi:hypothetical protein NDU88_007688 [Pleurodeles waltl]|uniref:Uncharacterized protein n=1 Tax=Pleurodeles waltl TaxID=8319 RepID=A0AAV7N639_PLEWA|nr:hypothetical protein NDU88_007688 [Pleurodeles waltl]
MTTHVDEKRKVTLDTRADKNGARRGYHLKEAIGYSNTRQNRSAQYLQTLVLFPDNTGALLGDEDAATLDARAVLREHELSVGTRSCQGNRTLVPDMSK